MPKKWIMMNSVLTMLSRPIFVVVGSGLAKISTVHYGGKHFSLNMRQFWPVRCVGYLVWAQWDVC